MPTARPWGWLEIIKDKNPCTPMRLAEARLLRAAGLADYSHECEDLWEQRDLKIGRAAVIGGLGFVGSHVVKQLLAVRRPDGPPVRILDRRGSSSSSRSGATMAAELSALGPVEMVELGHEFDDLAALVSALSDVSTVFICVALVDTRRGAKNQRRLHRANVEGTAALVAACQEAGVRRLVLLSDARSRSDGVWGDEQAATLGRGLASPYGLSRRASELIVQKSSSSQLRTVCVRAHVIFGLGDEHGTEALLLGGADSRARTSCIGRPLTIHGGGTNVITPIYVRNLAATLVAAATALGANAPQGTDGSAQDAAVPSKPHGGGGGSMGSGSGRSTTHRHEEFASELMRERYPVEATARRPLPPMQSPGPGRSQTPSMPPSLLSGGEIVDAGDAHVTADALRALCASCRPGHERPPPAVPARLPLWLSFGLATVLELLDRALCCVLVPCDCCCFTALTRASLYYAHGANFRFPCDAYSHVGLAADSGAPPLHAALGLLSFPDGIRSDLVALAKAEEERRQQQSQARQRRNRQCACCGGRWLWSAAIFALSAVWAFVAVWPGVEYEVVSEIRAPRHRVWRLVHDMGRWHEFQGTYHVQIDGLPREGSEVFITYYWPNGALDTVPERVVKAVVDEALCWDYEGLPDWILSMDTCVSLSASGQKRESTTILRIHRRFAGLLAPLLVLFRSGFIQQGLEAFNADLGCKLSPESCGRGTVRGEVGSGGQARPSLYSAAGHAAPGLSHIFKYSLGGSSGSSAGVGSAAGDFARAIKEVQLEHNQALERTASLLHEQQRQALATLQSEHEERMRRIRAELAATSLEAKSAM